MNTKVSMLTAALVIGVSFLGNGIGYGDQAGKDIQRPCLGVGLVPQPLPELLVKHLRLEPKQGILIGNVQIESPADKAGLDRDDIIIGFQGKTVSSYDEFVDDIRRAGVGADVSLEFIHLGERKKVTLTLAAWGDFVQWKYPVEPGFSERWRPGRMFRLKPGEHRWQRIPFGEVPEIEDYVKQFFKQQHIYHTQNGDESYSITIEGDPCSDEAGITVRIGNTEYKSTVGEIDSLPEKYRRAAREALESARKSSERSIFPDGVFDRFRPAPWGDDFSERWPFRPGGPGYRFGPEDNFFDQMQQQMRELMRRMKEMEQSYKDLFERYKKAPLEKKEKAAPDDEVEEL